MRLFPKALPSLLAALAILLSACGAKAGSPAPGPAVSATPTSASAGASAPASAPADFSWLRFTPPTGWRETSPGHYEGAGGYAWLELRSSPEVSNNANVLAAACFREANGAKPQTYGAYPEIRDGSLENQPACLILPSADQPTARRKEALYLLAVPASIRPDTLLALHADSAHIGDLSQKLAFANPQPTPLPSACDFSVAGQPRTSRANSLGIDEFPIARGSNCSPAGEPENFYQRIESGPAFARAEAVRLKQFEGARLSRLNAKLAPFGFRVEVYDKKLFRVLHQGAVERLNLSWVGPLSLSADGQSFFLPVVDSYNGAAYLVRPNGVRSLDEPDLLAFDLIFPVYHGVDRISLAYDYQHIQRPTGSPTLLQILVNNKVTETLSVSGSNPASGPVRGLWSWNGHWYLELPGLILEDGAILNDRLGYPEMFTWRLLKDQPFYFYRKDGQVGAVYNGQPLPDPYDDVLAGERWSNQMLVQMHIYESGLTFFARRGDVWYYVVLEAE